jgi:UDP-N-acetylmuramate dehydrogenase
MESMDELKIEKNIELNKITTFRIGGPAKYYFEASSTGELKKALTLANKNQINYFILGGGSNILANDNGYEGLVIKLSDEFIGIKDNQMTCSAGANLSLAVKKASTHGLSGLEWAVGIPGTVGGAVRGNAGAFGGSMSKSVDKVEVINVSSLHNSVFKNKKCGFSYRESIFKLSGKYLVLKIFLNLEHSTSEKIEKRMQEFLKRRKKIQPTFPSAGSIFKNIFFTHLNEANPLLADKAKEENIVKNGMIGAGWIIDQLGIKGKMIGGAMISREHANFIINRGNAKAEDVIMLISYIKQQVRDKFSIQLQEEIMYLGFE